MSKTKLIPTLPTHKRQCPEEHCIQWTFPLSSYESRYGLKDGFPAYKKILKWKCINGHVTTTETITVPVGRQP